MRVELRPARASDLPHLISVPLPHRIRAITAVIGDRVVGIGGIGYRPDGTVIGFAVITDALRKYPAALHRAGRAGMEMVRRSGVPMVVAEAEEQNPAAERWLTRLGFVKCEVDGAAAYVWERPANVE